MSTMIEMLTLVVTTSDLEPLLSPWHPLTFVAIVTVLTVGSALLIGADRRRTYKLLLEYTPPNTTFLDTGRRGQQVVCARGDDSPPVPPDIID